MLNSTEKKGGTQDKKKPQGLQYLVSSLKLHIKNKYYY